MSPDEIPAGPEDFETWLTQLAELAEEVAETFPCGLSGKARREAVSLARDWRTVTLLGAACAAAKVGHLAPDAGARALMKLKVGTAASLPTVARARATERVPTFVRRLIMQQPQDFDRDGTVQMIDNLVTVHRSGIVAIEDAYDAGIYTVGAVVAREVGES